MAISRRRFVEALGVSGVAALGPAARSTESVQSSIAPFSASARLVKLDQNENPNPPSARVAKAVMEALDQGHRYPRNLQNLLDALAKAHGVLRSNILVAAGSGELLRSTVLAFVTKERPLVAGLPTFETSTRTAKTHALPVREIPVDGSLRLDLSAMERAAVGAGLLFFCNPNNPTGTTWPSRDVEAMTDRLAKISPETITLIDEAYAQFVESKDYWSLAAHAARQPQLLVTRTFSKAYGLAGLRVGYAVGHADTIARLRHFTTSGSLPVTSVAAALAALEDDALVRSQIADNHKNRASIAKVFRELGCTVLEADANFILVDIKRSPEKFQADCQAQGVSVGRAFPGLRTHSRISIGTSDEMTRAAEVFRKVLAATT